MAIPICSDFDTPPDGSLQGWTTVAAKANVSVQGPSLLLTDFYLHGGDRPSPPYSGIEAPGTYEGDLITALDLNMAPACLEFDYIVYEEGFPGVVDVCPFVTLKDQELYPGGTRAVFECAPGMRVTEPAGSNPGWHHYKIPMALSSGGLLPSNAMGGWAIYEPGGGGATDWDTLLGNVVRLHFLGDIAGSPSQTEDFGIDNVCFQPNCNIVPDPFPTAGGPTPSVTPVPFDTERLPCSAVKKDCVSKKATGLLKCHVKAEKKGTPLDPACATKVKAKFDGSLLVPPNPDAGCFERAEANFGVTCTTTDDTAAMEAKVDAFIDDLVTELDPGYPTPIQNKCSAKKKQCAANKIKGLLKCHVKAERKGIPVTDPAIAECVGKVQGKFAPCFGKVELSSQPCLTLGDDAAIEAKIDAFVDDVVCELDPNSGTCAEPPPP